MNRETLTLLSTLAIAAVALYLLLRGALTRIVVGPNESAIVIRNGVTHGPLDQGVHYFLLGVSERFHFDLRQTLQRIAGQEVLTRDRVPVKLSLVLTHRIVDVERAFGIVEDRGDYVHAKAQLALRSLVAETELEELLESRASLAERLREQLATVLESVGLELHAAQVLDLMVSGELKSAFGDVAKARAEAQAKLERARGESAALRKLCNAARLFEQHAGLERLKTLEIAGRAAEGAQNTLVLGLDEAGRRV